VRIIGIERRRAVPSVVALLNELSLQVFKDTKEQIYLCAQHESFGVEEELHLFLSSALDGGEWLASCPEVVATVTHGVAGDIDPPRVCLDVFVKRKLSGPCRDSNPGSFNPVTNTNRIAAFCCTAITILAELPLFTIEYTSKHQQCYLWSSFYPTAVGYDWLSDRL